jgi:U3 small nucleolar RNA-associated protein 11
MQGRKWNGTVEGDRGNKGIDMDTARLLKTQDMGYIRTMRQVVRKEVARLEQQVVLTRQVHGLEDNGDNMGAGDDDDDDFDMPMPAGPKAPQKIVFMDDEDEREAAIQDDLDREEDDDQEQEFEGFGDDESKDDGESEGAKSLRRLKGELENARKKLQALNRAERELDIQRTKMAKTATSGGHTRKGKKIMVRTRKR